jgi:predicted  nucleic acid-binding Zn-ribbon protein
MSLEFAAHIANFAADELVSTRKELSCVNLRYEKIYNEHENLKYDHENLKEAMLEMEKKMHTLEQELSRLQEAEQQWSTEYILRESEDEWSKPTPDTDKIKMLDAKYEAARQIEDIKRSF